MDFFLGQPHNEDVQRTTDCRQFTRAALDGHACVFEEDIRDAMVLRCGAYWHVEILHEDGAGVVCCLGLVARHGLAVYKSARDETGYTLDVICSSDEDAQLQIEWDDHTHRTSEARGSLALMGLRVKWQYVSIVEPRRGRVQALRTTESI